MNACSQVSASVGNMNPGEFIAAILERNHQPFHHRGQAQPTYFCY